MPDSLAALLTEKGLLFASTNKGKLAEFRRILEVRNIRLLSPDDVNLHLEIEETAGSFSGNAALKAAAWSAASGMPAIADDSGLEVEALGGEPGVNSARFGGEGLNDADRRMLLLEKMRDVPADKRRAHFVCVLALSLSGHEDCEYYFRGAAEGSIAFFESGSGGFGYDPVFLDPETGRTFAELTAAEKDARSHRGAALRKFIEFLEEK